MPKNIILRLFAAAAVLLPLQLFAFEDLNEAQALIYDTSHLQNTSASQTVDYDYIYTDSKTGETINDRVRLSVRKEQDADRRDVSIDFLSEDRRMPLPNFDGYRANPVIIAMLEHLAQTMGRDTGGGVLYFRNRIRDGLAGEDIEIIDSAAVPEKDSPAFKEFVIRPFTGDPYLAERPEYTEAQISLRFSESVPGQVLSIKLISGPEGEPLIMRELSLKP